MKLLNLADVRRSRGLSQRELAARIPGMYQPRISMIELGTPVGGGTAERLAKVLGCSVDDLVTEPEPTITLKLSDLSPEILAALQRQ
jgi:transcriptional regulator with XRE-family HTH domain